jgi:hypothetical protein
MVGQSSSLSMDDGQDARPTGNPRSIDYQSDEIGSLRSQ